MRYAGLQRGAFSVGDRVLLTAFGGGLTWGSVALTWPSLSIPRAVLPAQRRPRTNMEEAVR